MTQAPSGSSSWSGDIPKDGRVELKLVIKAVKVGDWVIEAKAGYFPTKDSWIGDRGRIYVSVAEISAKASAMPPGLPTHPLEERVEAGRIAAMPSLSHQGLTPSPPPPESSVAALSPLSGRAPGRLKITGTYYSYVSEDRLPPPSEVRADVEVPTVWGGFYVYDGNNNFLISSLTGPGPTGSPTAGRFEIEVENPGSTGFYLKRLPHSSACQVKKPDGTDYYSVTPIFYPKPTDTTFDVGEWVIPNDWQYKGAWRIYAGIVQDIYDRGAWGFLVNEGPNYTPPQVVVIFPGSGTFYSTQTQKIEIESEDYTMALSVPQHEYGHFIMHQVYGGYFPPNSGGTHYIYKTSNSNMAWTEGWATLFTMEVQSYGRWDFPVFEWGNGTQVNLETPTWGTPGWDVGDTCEGRVTGALWDIIDSSADGYDRLAMSFKDTIWDVVKGQTDDTFRDFYDAWASRGHDVSLGLDGVLYQNTIRYTTVNISNISALLQGGSRPDPAGWAVPLTVKFFNPGADVLTATPVYSFNLSTAKSGTTAVCQATGVNTGTYDITAVSPHTLINLKKNVVISAPTTDVNMGTLLEGNADDNNVVNISDFGVLALAYGKTVGQEGYDARANFDRNNIVNIQDFGLLAVNYSKTSPVETQ